MQFELEQAIPILERTPAVLTTLLEGLPDMWIINNEGAETWSPFDVLRHLIHLEKIDWMGRARIILEHGTRRPFDSVNSFDAPDDTIQKKSLAELLSEFAQVRAQNIADLKAFALTLDDLALTGLHPTLGSVTLGNLLAAWVVHDLNHIQQIVQTMSRQYRDEVGLWRRFLGILDA